ncbi:glycoside hydrolase domain-containing protein [Paenibacillus cymbidii]|uniref:glycoside hydrolase domain-containing protein n=1 Tax=Paenibacillus cymbidii TaxID=1639034 RepID=UPI001081754D|nr:glycoside hydrolase domain-containing protein [Paenibacillus cymbidii]
MSNSYLIHDMIRICPQTGEVLEKEARVGSPGELRKNPQALLSPRNAYVSFQIILRLGGGSIEDIRIQAESVKGERGEIPAAEFTFYTQWFHRIQGRYCPDALVPLEEGQSSRLSLASVTGMNAIEGQSYAAVWADLFVPRDVKPGDYHGTLRVTTGAGTDSHPIRLRALETIVPNESFMIADLNSYADNLSRRIGCLRNNDNRYEDGTFFNVEKQFFRMAHEHRCLFHYLPYAHSGDIPPTFAPELEGKGKAMRVKDWSRFDEHFGPYLDGSAFADTKRGAIPIPFMYLPFNFHWPADYVKFGTKGYRTEFAAIMEEFHRHFSEMGWLRTKFELFLNHKKRYKLFPYDGDETRFVWDEKINDIFYDLAKEVLEKEGGAKFIFRTDASWSYGLHFEKYATMIKMWVVNQQIFSWFPEGLQSLRKAGDVVWTYGGTQSIGQSLMATVISPLTAVVQGVDGFCFWENTLWGDKWPITPDSDGRAALFYPGDELFGIRGPIPSIRLKTMRGAMQVADCMEQWIRRQPEGGRERIAGIIARALDIKPGSWWSDKPHFLDRPPYLWLDGMLSEAPSASLQRGQPPEAFHDMKQALWGMLG